MSDPNSPRRKVSLQRMPVAPHGPQRPSGARGCSTCFTFPVRGPLWHAER